MDHSLIAEMSLSDDTLRDCEAEGCHFRQSFGLASAIPNVLREQLPQGR